MFRVCMTGRNPSMRHLGRTHYVQVQWLKERFQSPDLKLIYEPSAKQAAEIYTKGFDNAVAWDHVSKNIAIVYKSTFNIKDLNDHVNSVDSEAETCCPEESDLEWDSGSESDWYPAVVAKGVKVQPRGEKPGKGSRGVPP